MTSESDRLLAEEVRLRDQAAADPPVPEVCSRLGKTLDELRAEAKRNVLARMSWHLSIRGERERNEKR